MPSGANYPRLARFSLQGNGALYAPDYKSIDVETNDCSFDGRYVYVWTKTEEKALRYDTQSAASNFDAGTGIGWDLLSYASVVDASTWDAGVAFDGRYMYRLATDRSAVLRLNTVAASFDLSAVTVYNYVVPATLLFQAFSLPCYDGRYLYLGPSSSDFLLRYDTARSFVDSQSWNTIPITAALAFANGVAFDGRACYFASSSALMRVDTGSPGARK
eukprot:TRINITY_DN4928_c0_g1_i1.p1 TRINITY_DN4928_c0_g1~~TRINITY_DN4928_c0_g1_i1.p1  ORF type:complete len:242 (+),score=43.17 TRINITY_DN4928_c0_g1_i1:76-726(+)